MAVTGLTVMAPAEPGKRLAYLNGALNALELFRHDRRTMAQEHLYREVRRDVEEQRQELLNSGELRHTLIREL
jgi:hypothetical protein